MKKKSLVFLAVLITMLMFTLSACLGSYHYKATKVKFIIDDEVVATVEVMYEAEMPDISPKEGYILSKWYFEEKFSEEFSFERLKEKSLKGEVSVYAKWMLPSESLVYSYMSAIDGYEVKCIANISGEVVIAESYDDGTNGEKPVKSIDSEAFSNCSGLTSITIPSSITSIGERAFYGCSGLASITIPDSVTSIGDYAFRNCSSLVNITLPFVGKSTTATGFEAVFGYIFGYLKSGTIAPINGTTYQYGFGFSFYHYYIPTTIKTVVITSGTSIGAMAFYGSRGLTSITIPSSVTSIGSEAFEGCSGLTSITHNGTKSQWTAISKGNWWNSDTGTYTVHCTDGNISKADS